jgi:prevent-host-death family protein
MADMAYEIPVTQARAELADLINRVVYGDERVVVTRHGKPLVGLVSAADLERLERLDAADGQEPEPEEIISTVSRFGGAGGGAAVPQEARRFGIAAEHRGPAASDGRPGHGS